MKEKQNSISKSFITLSGITIVEKIIGFIYQAVIAAAVGANIITDCYFSTFELLSLIDYSIIAAMAVALLKQYTTILVKDKLEGAKFLSNIRSIVLPAITLLSVMLFCFARPITYILAPSYTDAERSMLVQNIHWMSLVPTICAHVTFYLVVLRQQGKFAIVGLKSFFINVVGFMAIGVFIIIQPNNSIVLCLGYNCAMITYSSMAYFATRKTCPISWCKPVMNDDVKRFVRMWLPLIISNGIVRISLMVDRVISTTVGEGGATCLSYSQMLFHFIEGLFVTNISTILLSDFTNLVAQKDYDKINYKINNAISNMVIILIPISIISVVYSFDIVDIVFGHGRFDEYNVARVAGLLLFYAIGFVPSVVSNIFMQVHYSFGKAEGTMFISIGAIVINIITSLIFVKVIGLSGVAVGTSISYFVSGILYYIYVKKYLKDYKSVLASKFTIRIIISSGICSAIVLMIHKFIVFNNFVSLVLATLGGVGIYITILWMMKEPTIKNFGSIAKRMVRMSDVKP